MTIQVKSPIEWIVLWSSRGNIITLVSKYGLDYQLENKEGSNLSKWLYSFFLENAFSKSEKNMILLAYQQKVILEMIIF